MTNTIRVYLIHYSAPEWILSSVSSVLASDSLVEVFVVDNSGDAPDFPQPVKVLRPDRNLGFAGAANFALRHSMSLCDSDLCVIGAHDLHVEPSTLRSLQDVMRTHPKIGVLGPRPDSGLAVRPVVRSEGNLDYVADISGTCMMIRHRTAAEVNGFDESMGSYVEDVEFCLRAGDLGWDVARCRAVGAHGLGSAHSDMAIRLIAENRVLLRRRRDGLLSSIKLTAAHAYIGTRWCMTGRTRSGIAKLKALRRSILYAASPPKRIGLDMDGAPH
ncbi:MAG: glycosyltransferase [Actinobacteria bacterium]|uniref:Unannotated protein n=1 Tax=freshwater metagenome TaxID=449393 RepID=A0A6J6EKT2_9ZZZZ|nr:glycosyltransferase [Actinomycetota bacterium]